jgi:hypothetical protein
MIHRLTKFRFKKIEFRSDSYSDKGNYLMGIKSAQINTLLVATG